MVVVGVAPMPVVVVPRPVVVEVSDVVSGSPSGVAVVGTSALAPAPALAPALPVVTSGAAVTGVDGP